ncbi:MAG TPA: DNA topoisomerase VI subunit B, partial [Candidatus Bathyarchaeota archaeon]|nr:DNA topoisomerase VI subunit B [Candidatus Bathyarchaeota archaeon]
MPARFEEISPADFFYRYRDIAGFSNPARALFSAIRELIENALDACEAVGILPDIYLRLSLEEERDGISIYRLRIEDNGSGVPGEHIPRAFGQVLYGSKYRLMQSRGMFGLGGAMAILYGQITTHKPVFVMSSTGGPKVYKYKLMIDIKANRPIVLEREVVENGNNWHGTVVEFCLEGDYSKACPKVVEYLRQTALVNPYANLTFVDPRGRLYRFVRATKEMPPPPREAKPHPKGVDVELVRRMIASANEETLLGFLVKNFQRVGPKTATKFLEFAGFEPDRNPRSLKPDEVVRLVRAMKEFNGFISPDASCLSPLGPELLEAGVRKE